MSLLFFLFKGSLGNLSNFLHGTRGYIDQISRQIFLFKHISSSLKKENFENDSIKEFLGARFQSFEHNSNKINKYALIGTLEKRQMNCLEKNLLSSYSAINFNSVLICDRIKLKSRIFHSISYSRKGNCDSYTISYTNENLIKYGQINYFLEYNGHLYAAIQVLKIKDCIRHILPSSTGYIYETIKDYLFEKYYKIIDHELEKELALINVDCIQNRCLLITSPEFTFITELKYEFEHD